MGKNARLKFMVLSRENPLPFIAVVTSANKISSTRCTTCRCWPNGLGLWNTPSPFVSGERVGQPFTTNCNGICSVSGPMAGVYASSFAFCSCIGYIRLS